MPDTAPLVTPLEAALASVLTAAHALPTSQAQITALNDAIRALTSARDALDTQTAAARQRAAALTALTLWRDGLDGDLPPLNSAQAQEVTRLLLLIDVTAYVFEAEPHDDTLHSQCDLTIDGVALRVVWTYSYARERSLWSFSGAFNANGDSTAFTDVRVRVPANALPTNLKGAHLQALLYLIGFDHLHPDVSFYHRPAW